MIKSNLIQEAIECLLEYGDLPPRREEYITRVLIEEKKKYLEELDKSTPCYEIICKEERGAIKRLKKKLKSFC